MDTEHVLLLLSLLWGAVMMTPAALDVYRNAPNRRTRR
jgi:hypothetical protein